MEQGCQFPLSIEDILNCYSTETIRRTFQELKRDGEIFVDEETQKNWDKKEHKIRSYYRGKKRKSQSIDLSQYVIKDQEGRTLTI